MANEETKKAEVESKATAESTAPAADPMALSIGDLKNLSTVLDVASQRGAFRAAEMANVGFCLISYRHFWQKWSQVMHPQRHQQRHL